MEVAKLTNVTPVYKIGQVETRALNGVSMQLPFYFSFIAQGTIKEK